MTRIPPSLTVRLGTEASKGLAELLEAEHQAWKDDMLTVERFERRLVEETGKLRLEMGQLGSTLRQEMARDRFELLKWMLLFWIGQLAAMSAILNFMLKR